MTHAKQQLAKLEYNAREELGLQQEQARPQRGEEEHIARVLEGAQEVEEVAVGQERLVRHVFREELDGEILWTVLWDLPASQGSGKTSGSTSTSTVVGITCTGSEELVGLLKEGEGSGMPRHPRVTAGTTQEDHAWVGQGRRNVEGGGPPLHKATADSLVAGTRLAVWRVERVVRTGEGMTVEVRAEGEQETVMVDARLTGMRPGGLQGPLVSFNYRGRGTLAHPAEWALQSVVNHLCSSPEVATALRHLLETATVDHQALPSQRDAGPSALMEQEILPTTSLDLGQPTCGLTCDFCDGHLAHSSRTADPLKQLEQLADDGVEDVLLADGEPLHYPGVGEVVQKATMLGIKTVLHTSGPPLAREGVVDSLAQAGLDVLHLSVYHTEAAVHDAMVGMPGAWEQTMQGIESARSAGIAVRPGTIVMRNNVDIMKDLVGLLAQASGFPGVKVRWVRPPAWDQARYQQLTPRLDRGLATLVEQFGPALLWRSPLLWWTVPCAAQATGFGESPLWHLGDGLEHNYVLEPQQRLGLCPLAEECVYDCSLYELYAGLAEPGLQPVLEAAIRPLDTFGGVAEWTLVFAPTH